MIRQMAWLVVGMMVVSGMNTPGGAEWEKSEWGETAVFLMQNAPYPHESREEGYQGRNQFFPRDPHYIDNSVGIFIPQGYRAGKTIDLLYYFHGHQNNVRQSFERFQLREQIVRAGKNVILVFPQGPRDASDSGGGKLEEPDGLRRLTEEVLAKLKEEGKITSDRVGRVILSGHSGAYLVISRCLEHGGLESAIEEVYLLDASYGRLEQFVDWTVRNRSGRLRSVFTDHLADENVFLMTHLTRAGVRYQLLNDEDATPSLLRRERVVFLHTTRLDHGGTVQWLESWLNASRLKDL